MATDDNATPPENKNPENTPADDQTAPPAPETPKRQSITSPDDNVPDAEMPPAPNLEDEGAPQPPKLKKSPKGFIVVAVVVLVLAAAGVVGWLFFMQGDPATPTQENTAQTPEAADATGDVPEAQNTESFTSSPYRLTFMHPKTWTVTENNDNSLLIQSEDFTYQTTSGETKNGNFRLYVRKGGDPADSAIIAKGVAISQSIPLAYKNPTAAQRKETNLSLFGLDNTDNFAFMLITGNFDLKKGETLGPNFGNEAETFIIGGGFSEPGLEPGMATNPISPDNFQNTNAYKQAVSIIETFEIS